MKSKSGAGGRARAIGKPDLAIWVLNVVGFALMNSGRHPSQRTNNGLSYEVR